MGCISSSSGLMYSKPEPPEILEGGPHNAEAKPIYWLIGRRCWCGGTEKQRERLFYPPPPYTRGAPPFPASQSRQLSLIRTVV